MSPFHNSVVIQHTSARCSKTTRVVRTTVLLLAALGCATVLTIAQTPANGPLVSFTASTENVSGANDSIRIDLFRWSTDAERDQLLAAWNLTPLPGAKGRGGRRGPTPDEIAPDPAAVDDGPPRSGPAAEGRGGAGRGGAGRGGAGRGGEAAPRPTPESSLAAVLGKVPTVGYLWSSEVTGYSLHSAIRLAEPDGAERIVLITDRRLGAWNDLWTPVGSTAATDYGFSVIELHLNAKGEGEGKISLTGKVAADSAAKVIGLENYGASPVILKNVKRRAR